jgi:hypothetical protein
MAILTVIVVITRIGVNKTPTAKPYELPPGPAGEPGTRPPSDTMPS